MLGCKSLARAEVMWQAPLVARDVVWWPAGPGASRGRVAALTVSYNTRELTALENGVLGRREHRLASVLYETRPASVQTS